MRPRGMQLRLNSGTPPSATPDKAIGRGDILCISRKVNAARREKARCLDILTIFKQGPV